MSFMLVANNGAVPYYPYKNPAIVKTDNSRVFCKTVFLYLLRKADNYR